MFKKRDNILCWGSHIRPGFWCHCMYVEDKRVLIDSSGGPGVNAMVPGV